MGLYRISVKMRALSEGMLIEPGMYVEMSSLRPCLVPNLQSKEQVNKLFISKYGVNLKKMGVLNVGYLKEERIG